MKLPVKVSEEEINRVLNIAKQHNVKFIRIVFADLDSVIRGRVITIEDLPHKAKHGVTLPTVMQSAFGLLDEFVPGSRYASPVGEVVLIPDIKTFKITPWATGQAMMISEQYRPDGRPFEVDPRPRLRELLQKWKFEIKVGVELEFYLFVKNPDGSMSELKSTLSLMGIEIENYYQNTVQDSSKCL